MKAGLTVIPFEYEEWNKATDVYNFIVDNIKSYSGNSSTQIASLTVSFLTSEMKKLQLEEEVSVLYDDMLPRFVD